MRAGEPAQNLPAFGREVQNRAPLVAGIGFPGKKAFAGGAVDQLDGAVVPEAKALGGVGDGDRGALRRAGHLEQQLVLLRLQSDLRGGRLAELEEAAQFVAEVGQGAEERVGGHLYIS